MLKTHHLCDNHGYPESFTFRFNVGVQLCYCVADEIQRGLHLPRQQGNIPVLATLQGALD